MIQEEEGRRRVVIERVRPEIDGGLFAVKRVVGEVLCVTAQVFADGHDEVMAELLIRPEKSETWQILPMVPLGNDWYRAEFIPPALGRYRYTVRGRIARFATWQKLLGKRSEAGQPLDLELSRGSALLEEAAQATPRHAARLHEVSASLKKARDPSEILPLALSPELTALAQPSLDVDLATQYPREFDLLVEPTRALFSSWYALFPRSAAFTPGNHGTFRDCERLLPRIARMGFDVLYLPPIHPIGRTNRKGKNNSPRSEPGEPGSPWAIGAAEGGHKAVHPQLGTLSDFEHLVSRARELGIEVALDLAFQCAPDHPYVKDHPEWFSWRPDGTIHFAENPPKKYEDVVPFHFETAEWRSLWQELRSVVDFWIDKGVRTFRVDNPHTKPFSFWQWLISEIQAAHPEVLFLAEAFTRPAVMHRLAKVGFAQSYTYFTWRNSKRELTEYLQALTQGEAAEIYRPNFWPTTPDILPEFLQHGGRPGFIIRLALAATLSSSYGIYGPCFELCVAEALPGREEFLDSEKYEIRAWDLEKPGALTELIARVNRIRRENPALHRTRNLRFLEVENDSLLAYLKATDDRSNVLVVLVNLDPFQTQRGWLHLPLEALGVSPEQGFLVHDLVSEDKFIWQGPRTLVELDPGVLPVRIFRVHGRMRREHDFDYYY